MKIKIKYFILFGFLSVQSLLYSQNKIDSLTNLLKTDKTDTIKITHLLKLGREYLYINPDTGLIITNQALKISQKIFSQSKTKLQKNIGKKFMAKSYLQIGSCNLIKGNYENSRDKRYREQI